MPRKIHPCIPNYAKSRKKNCFSYSWTSAGVHLFVIWHQVWLKPETLGFQRWQKCLPAPATVGSVVPTCSSCTSMPPSVLDFGPPFLSLYWTTCDSEWSVQWETVMCVFYWPSCPYTNRIHLLRHAIYCSLSLPTTQQ